MFPVDFLLQYTDRLRYSVLPTGKAKNLITGLMTVHIKTINKNNKCKLAITLFIHTGVAQCPMAYSLTIIGKTHIHAINERYKTAIKV